VRDAVIASAMRTPIGRRNGALSGIHPVDLSATVLNGLIEAADITPDDIDDVIWGCATQISDQAGNVGRFAALAAGWPERIPGVTVNRACGSSQQAIDFAVFGVLAGQYEAVVAGGVEMMSRVPLGAARAVGMPYGPLMRGRYDDAEFNQGLSAEMIASRWRLGRTQLDEFAVRSHQLAAAAIDAQAFGGQLIPVATSSSQFCADEGVRRTSTVETLAGLKPAFIEDGVIHAGNSSQISDGAAALLVTSSEKAAALGLRPIARYVASVAIGDDPVAMLTGPIPATSKVLGRAGLSISDIGVFEVNEAFAPVPLAWGIETGADMNRVNPLGGAIAVGHPLGASGAILATRMLHHMRDHDIHFGLQTMCEAGGTANATIFELIGG
jgi:acetyl-CoA acyltransferase